MKSMHKTSAGEKRNELQMTAQGPAQDDRAVLEATRAPAASRVRQGEADAAATESRGPQARLEVQRGRNKPMF